MNVNSGDKHRNRASGVQSAGVLGPATCLLGAPPSSPSSPRIPPPSSQTCPFASLLVASKLSRLHSSSIEQEGDGSVVPAALPAPATALHGMHVCMYICMYICMYAYMYVFYIAIILCVHKHAHTQPHTFLTRNNSNWSFSSPALP